jgi:hypothetical protein
MLSARDKQSNALARYSLLPQRISSSSLASSAQQLGCPIKMFPDSQRKYGNPAMQGTQMDALSAAGLATCRGSFSFARHGFTAETFLGKLSLALPTARQHLIGGSLIRDVPESGQSFS